MRVIQGDHQFQMVVNLLSDMDSNCWWRILVANNVLNLNGNTPAVRFNFLCGWWAVGKSVDNFRRKSYRNGIGIPKRWHITRRCPTGLGFQSRAPLQNVGLEEMAHGDGWTRTGVGGEYCARVRARCGGQLSG